MFSKRQRLIFLSVLVTAAASALSLPPPTSAMISYVQGNYATPQTPQTTVSVTFTAAQAAGDLNVVVVGWNDSSALVSAVIDNNSNIYTPAVGPTVVSGSLSQSIYYAKNIAAAAAGANVVTVTFSTAAVYPDIRILEYSGADPSNPVDVTAAGSGTSSTSASASATTTNATDLIFGANIVATTTTSPGSGFTKRLLTPLDGDIVEDLVVMVTGSYSATAPSQFVRTVDHADGGVPHPTADATYHHLRAGNLCNAPNTSDHGERHLHRGPGRRRPQRRRRGVERQHRPRQCGHRQERQHLHTRGRAPRSSAVLSHSPFTTPRTSRPPPAEPT